jgi:hypothetical protein
MILEWALASAWGVVEITLRERTQPHELDVVLLKKYKIALF